MEQRYRRYQLTKYVDLRLSPPATYENCSMFMSFHPGDRMLSLFVNGALREMVPISNSPQLAIKMRTNSLHFQHIGTDKVSTFRVRFVSIAEIDSFRREMLPYANIVDCNANGKVKADAMDSTLLSNSQEFSQNVAGSQEFSQGEYCTPMKTHPAMARFQPPSRKKTEQFSSPGMPAGVSRPGGKSPYSTLNQSSSQNSLSQTNYSQRSMSPFMPQSASSQRDENSMQFPMKADITGSSLANTSFRSGSVPFSPANSSSLSQPAPLDVMYPSLAMPSDAMRGNKTPSYSPFNHNPNSLPSYSQPSPQSAFSQVSQSPFSAQSMSSQKIGHSVDQFSMMDCDANQQMQMQPMNSPMQQPGMSQSLHQPMQQHYLPPQHFDVKPPAFPTAQALDVKPRARQKKEKPSSRPSSQNFRSAQDSCTQTERAQLSLFKMESMSDNGLMGLFQKFASEPRVVSMAERLCNLLISRVEHNITANERHLQMEQRDNVPPAPQCSQYQENDYTLNSSRLQSIPNGDSHVSSQATRHTAMSSLSTNSQSFLSQSTYSQMSQFSSQSMSSQRSDISMDPFAMSSTMHAAQQIPATEQLEEVPYKRSRNAW